MVDTGSSITLIAEKLVPKNLITTAPKIMAATMVDGQLVKSSKTLVAGAKISFKTNCDTYSQPYALPVYHTFIKDMPDILD